MKSILTAALLVCLLHSANASTYYFSANSGDDSGTSIDAQNPSTPWKKMGTMNTTKSHYPPHGQ